MLWRDLKAGVIYKIKNFLVINNKTSYKVTSHKFLIHFTQHTVLAPTDYAGHDIERQNFRIRSYAEFNEAVNKNKNEDLYGKNFTAVHIKIYMIL